MNIVIAFNVYINMDNIYTLIKHIYDITYVVIT